MTGAMQVEATHRCRCTNRKGARASHRSISTCGSITTLVVPYRLVLFRESAARPLRHYHKRIAAITGRPAQEKK
jgi:hypothetical protein